MTHIARAFRCPSNIKFLSVEVAMDFEDLAKSPCECTFQTFFQLPFEARQKQTNAVAGAVEDLTTFWGPNNISLMSVNNFTAMVFLTSNQVGAASLKQP